MSEKKKIDSNNYKYIRKVHCSKLVTLHMYLCTYIKH